MLLKRIRERDAIVAILGLGYVGLPLAIETARAGFQVIGVDLDPYKVKKIGKGESYILGIKDEWIYSVVEKKKLSATSDSQVLKNTDIVVIAVPTPLSKSKTPDMSYIVRAMEDIKSHFIPGKLIILESTTYPGTTRELIIGEMEKSGFVLDKDFYAAYSPERVDPGNTVYNTKNTPRVIGGASQESTEIAAAFYSEVIDTVVTLNNCEEAEMTKLLENTFRAVNIGFINELAMMCDRMGINIWNVIEGAKTKPFGFMPFYPGPGIGGHCIPLDPMYLSWKAKHYGFFNRHIELATEINDNMPDFIVDKLLRLMNKHKKLLNGAKVLLLGVAYKSDVDDARESPALAIYEKLKMAGADVKYYDPYVSSFHDGYGNKVHGLETLGKEMLRKFDLVILITPHKIFDYKFIAENANLIFDTRNAFREIERDKVEYL